MTRLAAAPAFALLLVACEPAGQQPAEGERTRPITVANPFHERLLGLGETDRNLALRRAIQDSGFQCQRLDAAGYQEDYRGMPMWAARCADGREWQVYLSPGGDVQVRNCDEAEQLGLPACRVDEAAANGAQPG